MIGSAHGPHGEPVGESRLNIIGGPGSGQPATESGRPRLLLVGDRAARPAGLERSLVRGGFEVAEVPLGAVRGAAPAAVLLTAAGEVDAAGALDILRQRLAHGVPVVAALSEASPDAATRLLEAGAADVVTGAVHHDELLARIATRVRTVQEAASALQLSEQTARLFDVFQDISVAGDEREVLRTLVTRLGDVLGVSHCACVLAGPAETEGRLAVSREDPEASDLAVELWQYPEVTEAVRSATTVFVAEVMLHPLFLRARVRWSQAGAVPPASATAAIPLRRHGRTIGAVVLRAGPGESLTLEQVRHAERLVRATARLLEHREASAG